MWRSAPRPFRGSSGHAWRGVAGRVRTLFQDWTVFSVLPLVRRAVVGGMSMHVSVFRVSRLDNRPNKMGDIGPAFYRDDLFVGRLPCLLNAAKLTSCIKLAEKSKVTPQGQLVQGTADLWAVLGR
jgi:hypothetical protein